MIQVTSAQRAGVLDLCACVRRNGGRVVADLAPDNWPAECDLEPGVLQMVLDALGGVSPGVDLQSFEDSVVNEVQCSD